MPLAVAQNISAHGPEAVSYALRKLDHFADGALKRNMDGMALRALELRAALLKLNPGLE
jgi:hypothetical protein